MRLLKLIYRITVDFCHLTFKQHAMAHCKLTSDSDHLNIFYSQNIEEDISPQYTLDSHIIFVFASLV